MVRQGTILGGSTVKLFVTASAAILLTATPALADQFFAVTPSGAAETLFPEHAQTVASTLAGKCIDSSWTVTSSSPTEVVCEAPLNMGQSIVGQLLMGNSYSTPPRRFYKFNISEIDGVSRVQASGWMELQMAFGQMKRTDFSGPEFQNSVINFMAAAGGKLPPGTTFPNHAYLGITGANVPQGKNIGIQVATIEPGSPADKSGMQVGDVVTAIAGKSFKDMGGFLDATAKAASKPQYAVSIIHQGKPSSLTVDRAYRPAITETVVAKNEPVKTTPPPNGSMADELTKLAKLHSDGVLTDSEFQAQKAKLLAQ